MSFHVKKDLKTASKQENKPEKTTDNVHLNQMKEGMRASYRTAKIPGQNTRKAGGRI
jgi:hypothetical protein